MAWQDEMTVLLRVMLQDLSATPTYSDDSLQLTLVGAAQLVEGELDFTRAFAADLVNVDITPDPTDRARGTRDDNFVNLVSIKAAAIVDQGVARTESGIVIRDNGSMVDLRAKLQAALQLVKSGWGKYYEEQKLLYQAGLLDGTVAGAAVLSRIRTVAADWLADPRSGLAHGWWE